MGASRWETTRQSLRENWGRIKIWTLEKSKSWPIRWSLSALSGFSFALPMHEFIPYESAGWLTFNIILTGTTFIVAARLTSHNLSAQHEIPEEAREVARTTAKQMVIVIIEQENENINRLNNTHKWILGQLQQQRTEINQLKALLSQQESNSAPQIHLADILLSDNENVQTPLLAAEPIRLAPTPEPNIEEENDSHSLLNQCWQRIRGYRLFTTFSQSATTELTEINQRNAQYGSQVRFQYTPDSPVNREQDLSSYQHLDTYQPKLTNIV